MIVNAPRLTIGIPTLDRIHSLSQAVESALAQSVPVKVLIADQGGTDATAAVLEPFRDNPLVSVLETKGHATNLWENWTLCAAGCQTEFFAWLQDDDVVAPHFSRRVLQVFDAFPRAHLYLARLGISIMGGCANWWQATGPMVPMDLIRGLPTEINPSLLCSGAFFHSFALSPGMAFKCTLEAIEAIKRVPKDCDLFAERLVLAEMSQFGASVCDPAIVGYWSQHAGNESRRQMAAGDVVRQYNALAQRLDKLLDGHPQWQTIFGGWAMCVGVEHIRQWLQLTEQHAPLSAKLREARAICLEIFPADELERPTRSVQPETTTNRKQRRAERTVSRG